MTWLVRDTNSAKGLAVHRDGHDLEAFSINTPLGHPISGVTTDGQHLVETARGSSESKRRRPRVDAVRQERRARDEDAQAPGEQGKVDVATHEQIRPVNERRAP